jgi:stress response protein SCP2
MVLIKGQKVNLERDDGKELREIVVGLGWSTSDKSKTLDIDASALLLNEAGKIAEKEDVIYYNAKKHTSGAVWSTMDIAGERSGGEEQLIINLKNLPDKYRHIIFFVTMYQSKEKKLHFGMIKNAFIRIIDKETNKELIKYPLAETYPTMRAIIFGELYKKNGNGKDENWKFNAIGNGLTIGSITEVVDTFR